MAAALERKIGEGQSMHVTYLDVFRAADLNHDNELSFEELLAVMYPLANNKELRAAASSCGFNAEEV
ncbi:EF hand, partial [Haematococcus lacustris]